jgi:hypothetical protein
VTFHTIRAIEQGKPGTAIGHYANVLWVLGLLSSLSPVGDPSLDAEGIALESIDRPRRARSAGRSMSNDF